RKPQCAGRPDQNIKQMDISKIRQEIIRAY
ncbi:MAG: hypothetical protein ACI9H8_002530, partial [Lysobacterales bacterium]